jgi:hypothetical protein
MQRSGVRSSPRPPTFALNPPKIARRSPAKAGLLPEPRSAGQPSLSSPPISPDHTWRPGAVRPLLWCSRRVQIAAPDSQAADAHSDGRVAVAAVGRMNFKSFVLSELMWLSPLLVGMGTTGCSAAACIPLTSLEPLGSSSVRFGCLLKVPRRGSLLAGRCSTR